MKRMISLCLAMLCLWLVGATAQAQTAHIEAIASGAVLEAPDWFVQSYCMFNGYSEFGVATVVNTQTREWFYVSMSAPVVTETGFQIVGQTLVEDKLGLMVFEADAEDAAFTLSFQGRVLLTGHLPGVYLAP